MKGEPGIPDHSLIEFLRNITRALQRGYMELDNGWITPFNGYKYKVTPDQRTWNESRRVCQSWGGDLIVHGFRDYAVRVTIQREFNLSQIYWIGLNDQVHEGNWMWVNGNHARSDDATLWRSGYPTNSGRDCGVVNFRNFYLYQFLVQDYFCFLRYKAICEKLL